jgi:hypothetical protein
LNGLEALKGRVREVVKEGVTVVKAGGNKGVGEGNSSVGVKEGPYLSEGAKMEEGRLADSGDMAGEGMVRIEGHTKVEGGGGRGDNAVVKGNGRVNDLGALLRRANNEEFSFGRVEGEFIGGEPMVERVKDVSESG